MSVLISVPAGRSFRRPGTKWVDPQPEKGLIEVQFEDDLLHLWWKSRDHGAIEDELIIFPGEATFEKVQQDQSGRTHILKFSSSDQKYFFWFQRASKEGDLRAEVDINNLLQDPSYRPGSAPLPELPSGPAAPSAGAGQSEGSFPPTPGAPRLAHAEPAPVNEAAGSSSTAVAGAISQDQATHDMARLLSEWAQSGGLGEVSEDAHLTDVLSPANISTLLRSHPELASTLTSLLPPSLSLPPNPSAEDLIPILTAPQFTEAIASLDNALRSGGLPGSMMTELGLPESAGRNVKEFLEGLKGLQGKGGQGGGAGDDDRMEQD